MDLAAIAFAKGLVSISPLDLYEDSRLLSKTGIERVFAEETSTRELSLRSARQVINDFNKSSIEVCILVTQTPDDFLPANSISIACSLGLSSSVIPFDINQGCSGFVQSLCLVDALLSKYHSVLLLTGDRYRSKLHPDDRATNAVFSDASTASIWTRSPRFSIVYEAHLTDGSKRDWLYHSTNQSTPFLHMSGAEVWMFTKTKVLPEILSMIQYCQDSGKDIANIYIHQASKVVVDGICQGLPLEVRDRLRINYHIHGNTVSSSIPILMHDFPISPQPGTVNLFAGFGVGLTCSFIVLEESCV